MNQKIMQKLNFINTKKSKRDGEEIILNYDYYFYLLLFYALRCIIHATVNVFCLLLILIGHKITRQIKPLPLARN